MNAIKQSGKYVNKSYVKMQMDFKRLKGMAKDYIKKKDTIPPFKMPRVQIDTKRFLQKDSLIWLGHSTILGHLNGVSFIVDPMLNNRASPIKCMGPKRFNGSLTPIEELTKIDFVLITHNHYDHMDKETLLTLVASVNMICVPMDNAKILYNWGIPKQKVLEYDWYESFTYSDVTFTFCPTQHFSGRGLHDKDKALWGSWAIQSSQHSVYISGDSGYNAHFKEIAQKLGGFDIACMECGAYNENWSEIHMYPQESVQASLDLNAKVMLPMHWASFDLSTHAWDEPITKALEYAKSLNVDITTPRIGQVVFFENAIVSDKWWQEVS